MKGQFLFGNESIQSIFFAAALLFFLPFFIKTQLTGNVQAKIFSSIFVISAVYLLLLTNGRAGWIGFLVGSFFILKTFNLFSNQTKKFHVFFIAFLVIIICFCFFYKHDSSSGRLLIYKVSSNIFKDHWLFGIGYDKFHISYNLYQAKYFSANNINSKEALLAGNTLYAFNDLWQLLIELGALRFILIILLAFAVIMQLKKYQIKPNVKLVFLGSCAALFCLLIASLFSYPLHVWIIQILTMLYLTSVMFSVTAKNQYPFYSNILIVIRCILILVIGLILYDGYKEWNKSRKAKEAFDLSLSGFRTDALKIWDSLYRSNNNDGTIAFAYAKNLYNSSHLKEAKLTLEHTRKFYIDNDIFKLSAAINKELNDFKKAEEDYKTAVYMVPNRMSSRYELMDFYFKQKDTADAIFWCNSILEMPVKVTSKITEQFQKETKKVLLQLNGN